jgi:hypothetical protein
MARVPASEPVVDVGQEVLDGLRRLVGVELDLDLPQGGGEDDHGVLLRGGASRAPARKREEHSGDDDEMGFVEHGRTVANAPIYAPRRAAGRPWR